MATLIATAWAFPRETVGALAKTKPKSGSQKNHKKGGEAK